MATRIGGEFDTMRNGFKIFDADTHVRPDADLLEPYLSTTALAKLGQFEQHRTKNKEGAVTYLMGTRHYKRRLSRSVNTSDRFWGFKRLEP